jgi:hypothetical protein
MELIFDFFFFFENFKLVPSALPAGTQATISNCNFAHNHADIAGAGSFYPARAYLRNITFFANSAKAIGGALWIAGFSETRTATFIDVADCHFDSNVAGAAYPETGEGYPVVAVSFDAEVRWGPSTYRNVTTDPSKPFSYALRVWKGKFTFTEGDGSVQAVSHPDIFVDEEGKVDCTRVPVSLDRALLFSPIYIGDYDVQISGDAYLRYVFL